ncbi:unnamed protein product [Microthlaspi erraticum]|uniref:Uncharacterized protein n=1 Tax=Microthlaspi erraticum TaxID=1685480 RepID=A0A6D2JPI5_9BRAS|nr:unnamed protein product [Microthlaspi erraticum]
MVFLNQQSRMYNRTTHQCLCQIHNQPFHPLDEARETESLDELQLGQPFSNYSEDIVQSARCLRDTKLKRGRLKMQAGLTQIVNQSGSASGRMDGLVAELRSLTELKD